MYRINFNETVKKNVTLTFFALFLLLCIFSLMIGSTFRIAEPPKTYLGLDASGETLEQRLAFLRALGLDPIEDSEESESIIIPAVFSDVYKRYNELQKQSGGDLSLYKTAVCTRYTYLDEETGMHLDLIVYEGKIIGGDKCTYSLDGEMEPLGTI